MSLVHLCMPSKRPASEVNRRMAEWRERGYWISLQRDPDDFIGPGAAHDVICRPYKGYPEAVNFLAKRALAMDPECQWIVCAGDDTQPDPTKTADEIAAQCSAHFLDLVWPRCWHWAAGYKTPEDAIAAGAYAEQKKQGLWSAERADVYRTFGVMQPTGDRWGADEPYAQQMWPDAPAMIDRICGSPWLGRSFCERINQGEGPLWREYHHNWADEELQCVAKSLGILWQRRDLIHYHEHSRRKIGGQWLDFQQGFDADYKRMEPVFRARKAAGFPGSEPL